MKNKIFSLVLVLLFVFGISLLAKDQEGYLFAENREKVTNDSFIAEPSFDTANKVLRDQMPFRDDIINTFSKLFSKFSVGDKLVCYKREYIRVNDVYLDNTYTRASDDSAQICSSKAYNINEISNKYKDIKTYVYYPRRSLKGQLLDSIYIPNNFEQYEQIFLSHVGDKITYQSLDYSDEELSKYFYKTDQHYNAIGADKVYKDIIYMINKNFNIGEPLPLLSESTINNKFIGSYGDNNGRIVDVYDNLTVGDYGINIDEYDYYVNGQLSSIIKEQEATLKDPIYSKVRTYDAYYNVNAGNISFDYHDDSKKNILIFTDSYIGPLKEVLSSHFNKTIMVCGSDILDEFDLDRIIKENNVDIILFLWYQNNLYSNGYYFVPIS